MMPDVTESWELAEGAQIAEGRAALKSLGGGTRYEVYLVWDERLFSLAVAKILRPDRIEDERSLRDLGVREAATTTTATAARAVAKTA